LELQQVSDQHPRGELGRTRSPGIVLIGLVFLISIFLAVSGGVSHASAQTETGWFASHTEEEQQAIIDYLYLHGPQGVTPYPGAPAETGLDLERAIREEGLLDEGADLAAESTEVMEETGLIRQLWELAPSIAAVGTAFSAGILIGSGVNAKFLHLGLDTGSAPNGSDTEFCYSEACGGLAKFFPFESSVYYNATVQQVPGAYLYYGSLNGSRFTPVRWFEPPCHFTGFEGPPRSRLASDIGAGVDCVVSAGEVASVRVDYPYALPSDFLRLDFLHPYDPEIDGEPDIAKPAPPDPGVSTVEDRAENALDGEGQQLHRDWIDWRLEPDHEPEENPKKIGAGPGNREDPRCSLSDSSAPHDPGSGTGRAAVVETFAVTVDPWSNRQLVNLHWGSRSWGYRHIVYRRGWGTQAQMLTQAALTNDLDPKKQNTDHSFRYYQPYFGANGFPCFWRVVVEYQQTVSGGGPKDIITALPVTSPS
jgi:hypothetical protein